MAHSESPAGERTDEKRGDGKNGVLKDAADEIDAPARSNTEHVITTIGWEPVQVNAKKVNQDQGDPEIGNGREKRQDWGHSSIVPGAALPVDQHTDQGPD